MTTSAPAPATSTSPFVPLAGDLLPLADAGGVMLTGYASLRVWEAFAGVAMPGDPDRLVWVIAGIAPFLLYEQGFGESAGPARAAELRFLRRLLIFLVVGSAVAFAGRWLDHASATWLAAWVTSAVAFMWVSRVQLGRILQRGGTTASVAAPMFGTAQISSALRVTVLADRPIRRWSAVIKTAEDFVLGSIALLLLLPVLAGIALAIRLDSPGPIIFRQRRDGLNNRDFEIYKFRTMQSAIQAPGAAMRQTVRGDRRVTRVGRFLRKYSLDELPQVFNVLRGEMSLVGPRPHAVDMRTEEQLGQEIVDVYPHRHRVKPGITGWSQVNGCRGATHTAVELRRRVDLDLFYIDHWSVLFDLRILFLTVREVARPTNAF